MNPWLGAKRGFLSDWVTQQWVRVTGRRVDLRAAPWLRGPCGQPEGVTEAEFERYAAAEGLEVVAASDGTGLVDDFAALRSDGFDPAALRPEVIDFYERTSHYRLHMWSQWCGAVRPLGRGVDAIFARRLGQLQLPLAPLDTAHGVSSDLLRLRGPAGEIETAWVRRRLPGREVLYAGVYRIARPPLAAGPCVKVVFPLPNGSASVFLEPRALPDGSLELISAADRFGGAGFYFVVRADAQTVWAKHVPQFTERIRVFVGADDELHTEHAFRLWRRDFLRLHYLMIRR